MKNRKNMLLELKQLARNKSYVGLMCILLVLMLLAAWNTSVYTSAKLQETESQIQLVQANDAKLISEIEALNQGTESFEGSYTLPTNGIRLTFNNHRVTWLPLTPFSLVAIGQGDLFSNYKKIILYNNDSYEMRSEELVSPLEQLFGQLDLTFVWVYLLPLIILLTSFNVLSAERESGRFSLIASQPIRLSSWLLEKLAFRFLTIFTILTVGAVTLLLVFGAELLDEPLMLGQLVLLLFLYSGFWFLLSFLVNLAGYSSGKSLIFLTSIWVFFVFLVPTTVNLLAKEFNPVPSRLEIVNHHQAVYNEMEGNLDTEMQNLYETHPDWASDDPITKDMSNPTGWNINFLAKQYIAQLKHRPVAEAYEAEVDKRNAWLEALKVLSPSLLAQSALTDMAGTSAGFYRSFLKQSQEYAETYRQFVFKGIFTNHSFTAEEVRQLPVFQFDSRRAPQSFGADMRVLIAYLVVLSLFCTYLAKQKIKNPINT